LTGPSTWAIGSLKEAPTVRLDRPVELRPERRHRRARFRESRRARRGPRISFGVASDGTEKRRLRPELPLLASIHVIRYVAAQTQNIVESSGDLVGERTIDARGGLRLPFYRLRSDAPSQRVAARDAWSALIALETRARGLGAAARNRVPARPQ